MKQSHAFRSPSSGPYHRVWRLAWPMILSNISVPLLGVIDTAILGHLPSAEYLSGVAIGASILTMLLWAFGFLRMGTTGLVARASDEGSQWLLRALLFALLLGCMLLLFVSPLLATIVRWMNASAEAAPHARDYLQIRLLSAPLALANFALLGFFIGRQDSRALLGILVTANFINIALDLLLIIGFSMGARGAAWASVAADCSACILAFWLLHQRHAQVLPQLLQALGNKDFWPWRQLAPWLTLLRINTDLFVRTCLLLFTLTFFTAQGASRGDNTLAANAILLQLLMMTAYALDGFAHATEALVGESIAQRSQALFRSTLRCAGIFALGTAIVITLLLIAGEPLLLPLFTNIPGVLTQAQLYYPWLCALPLIAVWSYQLDGVFIGSGKSRQMRNTMFVATVLIFLPAWWLSRPLGNHGIWLSLILFFSARSVGLLVCYYQFAIRQPLARLWL